MEIIEIKSDHEFETPDLTLKSGTEIPLDKDGNVIITDVEFPMPNTVVTVHYDGTETEHVPEEADKTGEKTVLAETVDTKVVKTPSTKAKK